MKHPTAILSLYLFTTLGVSACDPMLEDTELLDEEIDEDIDDDFDSFRSSLVIPDVLPLPAPGAVPEYDQLLELEIGGIDYDIRDLLAANDGDVPRARITGVFRTTPTPVRPNHSAVSTTSLEAAQVYRCDGASWVFQRPEAGLVPLYIDAGGSLVPQVDSTIRDHFRFPGDGAIAAGPAWRITTQTVSLSSFTQRFVGSTTSPDFSSVTNPDDPTAINLLRVPSNSPGGPGSYSRVSFSANLPTGRGFLLRLATEGGRAPNSCAASENGNELRVPYSTDYYFVQLVES